MKTIFKNIWKPSKGVIIRYLDKNLSPFRFSPVANKAHVLNEGLWPFDGNILLLIELRGLKQPLEVEFTKGRFWVKAMDVPPLKQTTSFAKVLRRRSRGFHQLRRSQSLLCG